MAHASGWLGRAHETIEREPPCAVNGLLMIPACSARSTPAIPVRRASWRPRPSRSVAGTATRRRCARHAGARSGTDRGRRDRRGLAKLDAAMLAVEANSTGPISSGVVYCAVILECMSVFDYRRGVGVDVGARRMVPDAARTRAVPWPVSGAPVAAAVRRRDEATAAIRASPPSSVSRRRLIRPSASRITSRPRCTASSGRTTPPRRRTPAREPCRGPPNPGLALLQLQLGAPESAAATIRRALDDAVLASRRPALLSAAVEIFRAVGDGEGCSDLRRRRRPAAGRRPRRSRRWLAPHGSDHARRR